MYKPLVKDEPPPGTRVKLLVNDLHGPFKKGEIGRIASAPETYKTIVEMGYKPPGSNFSQAYVEKGQYEVIAEMKIIKRKIRVNFGGLK